jgi:hypothetical protein
MEGRTPASRQRFPKATEVYPGLSVQDGLAALVGVMDHIGWAPLPDRHFQGVQDQLGSQVRRHGPPHDSATPLACGLGRQASTTTARYNEPVQVEM